MLNSGRDQLLAKALFGAGTDLVISNLIFYVTALIYADLHKNWTLMLLVAGHWMLAEGIALLYHFYNIDRIPYIIQ